MSPELKDHVAGKKVELERGGETRWAKIVDVQGVTIEVRDRDNQRQDRSAIQLVYREVQIE